MKKYLFTTFILFVIAFQNAYSQDYWLFTFDSYINNQDQKVNTLVSLEIRKSTKQSPIPTLVLSYENQKKTFEIGKILIHKNKYSKIDPYIEFIGKDNSSYGPGAAIDFLGTRFHEASKKYTNNDKYKTFNFKVEKGFSNDIQYLFQSDSSVVNKQFVNNKEKLIKWLKKIGNVKVLEIE